MAQAGREFDRSGRHGGRQAMRGLAGDGITSEESILSETVRGVDAGRLDLVA